MTHLAFMTVVVLPLVAYPMAMPTRCLREVCGPCMPIKFDIRPKTNMASWNFTSFSIGDTSSFMVGFRLLW